MGGRGEGGTEGSVCTIRTLLTPRSTDPPQTIDAAQTWGCVLVGQVRLNGLPQGPLLSLYQRNSPEREAGLTVHSPGSPLPISGNQVAGPTFTGLRISVRPLCIKECPDTICQHDTSLHPYTAQGIRMILWNAACTLPARPCH